MNLVRQFLLYNLMPAIAAGLLSWLFVVLALRIFRIKYGWLRMSLLYAPLLKSILVLLGIGTVLQWPRAWFGPWQENALPFVMVAPLFVIWVGVILLIREYFRARARQHTLSNSVPAATASPRLQAAMQRVQAAYDKVPAKMVGQGMIVCVKRNMPETQLFVTEKGLDTPLILANEREPTIVFPNALISKLTNEELDSALAHELAHFMLSNPAWCSSDGIRTLTSVSPIANFLTWHLKREEEKACDDMAITALGNSEVYPEMLLKSYRFAVSQKNIFQKQLQTASRLLGGKPIISERIERLLKTTSPQRNLGLQCCLAGFIWLGLAFVFGFS
jgi:Zn-dependent protease with chaperone function